jgi:hypothetical protein
MRGFMKAKPTTQASGVLLEYEAHGGTPDEIGNAFEAFIESLAVKGIESSGASAMLDAQHEAWYPAYGKRAVIPFDHAQVAALRTLFAALKKAFVAHGDRRYQEGYKDGQNLIVQLARGEVSLDHYREESGEKESTRRPRRR